MCSGSKCLPMISPNSSLAPEYLTMSSSDMPLHAPAGTSPHRAHAPSSLSTHCESVLLSGILPPSPPTLSPSFPTSATPPPFLTNSWNKCFKVASDRKLLHIPIVQSFLTLTHLKLDLHQVHVPHLLRAESTRPGKAKASPKTSDDICAPFLFPKNSHSLSTPDVRTG